MQSCTDTALESISLYFQKITDLCNKNADFPEELHTCLQTASSIISKLTHFPEKVESDDIKCPGTICRDTYQEMAEVREHTGNTIHKMLLQLTGAKHILYLPDCSSSSVLSSLGVLVPEDGRIVVGMSDLHEKEVTQGSLWKESIDMRIGPTTDILKELVASGEQFDTVFIDATEQNLINYYNLIISSNMLKMNGVICLQTKTSQMNSSNENETVARKITDVINADPGVEQIFCPGYCSVTVAKRKPLPPTVVLEKGISNDAVFSGYNRCCILDRLRLDGKVAYVTGGGQGIGRAFSHALGEAGAKIAVIDIALEKAKTVALELELKGIKSVAMAADVSKEEDVQRIVDNIVANWGRIDIACNNAGINMNSASEDTTLEEWDKTFNVNLRGLFMCCQAAGRVMLSQGYGKIINTASMASLIVPHPQKQLAYNTSKAGVVKLTQTLGTEWIDRGVRVNCISPGIVDTPLIHTDALKPLVQCWMNDIPAGRLAQVTDLQAAVVFLASEASDYMTGHNLVIEGGQSLW
ncbi:2,4-dienoyl-CoA reductase [(3E)-enoyl-CoA-producing], mitochondrial-like [Pelobates fuscus]|uniref:2,4-dienoyl-CoA reductase [(3E)-enoyl-CoA-producing], mitochondrial-like n=1 Tax=Pelobates fuscus TaxID=191477 RepID=UPI002FE49014